MRMDGGNMAADLLVCLSPNGCCVAVGVRGCIYFFDSGHLLTNSEWDNDCNCGQGDDHKVGGATIYFVSS